MEKELLDDFQKEIPIWTSAVIPEENYGGITELLEKVLEDS